MKLNATKTPAPKRTKEAVAGLSAETVQGPTGQELVTEMGKTPTLDSFLNKQPPLSDKELTELVGIMRTERAIYIAKGEK